ncbi:MAG: ATP-dependent Clp protease ATP-binding subunit, partial [Clostridia bacterium]|nr:ATP-dependent Clp protease ATP-binding subunit [Clostridia bacterium]
ISDNALWDAVRLSKRYLPDRCLPDKAIDLIDEASATLKMTRNGKEKPVLTGEHIARAVESRTGIPLSAVTESENTRLRYLESELKQHIIGQDEAVDALSVAVRRARTGVRAGGRPNSSFLFMGRAGVGKTECAKVLAKAVFHSEKAFIRLDMSEFSEPHSVSKIIGAPPGYMGYNEGGALTERVRRNPYSLVLFDEIEKASPDVRALMLQILDEGRLTDSSGLSVSFDNTVIIMTANSGQKGSNIGFSENGDSSAVKEATKLFAPELVDRVDEVILFRPLEKQDLCSIVDFKMRDFKQLMEEKGVNVEIAREFALDAVKCAESMSARAVSRIAMRFAEEAVSDLLLTGMDDDAIVEISIENGRGIAKIKQNTY